MIKKYIWLLIVGLLISATSYGQLTQGKMALTTNGSGIGASYALANNMRLNAGVDLSFQENYTRFGVNGGLWLYRDITTDLAGYFGGGFGFTSMSYTNSSTNSFHLNAVYGAEYWLSPMFSVNLDLGADIQLSPDFGISFMTEGGLSWWFK